VAEPQANGAGVPEQSDGGAMESPGSAGEKTAPEQRPKRKQRGSDSMARGYAKAEERNQAAREGLEPLGEGERPLVVTLGAIVAGLVALSIVVGYLAGVKADGETPKVPQVVGPVLILGVMSWGMWRARYWAVLGFQLILVFLIFAAVSGLAVSASTAPEFLATGILLAISGGFFYFMVKAMARIQMPERSPRD
jgi:hypothetical protein